MGETGGSNGFWISSLLLVQCISLFEIYLSPKLGSRLLFGVRQGSESSLCYEFLELCLGSWRSKSEFVTDPFQLLPNCFTTLPTHLAMSSVCSNPNSHAVFLAQNEHKKITHINNTCHAHSHIEPTEAYPTPYEVRHWLWRWLLQSDVW